MIFDLIENCGAYKGISPAMDKALEFLASTDLAGLKPGRNEVGEGVFCNFMDCAVKPAEETMWEYHRKYIDIQILLEPGEIISVRPVSRLEGWDPFDEEKDISFTRDPARGTALDMEVGTFAVFFPQDAHRPCQAKDTPGTLKKAVIKVPV